MRARSIEFLATLSLLTAIAALLAGCAAQAPAGDEERQIPSSLDALAPKTRLEDALALPLHTATVCTADLEQVRRFYVDGLGLTLSGPIVLDADQRAARAELWRLPQGTEYELYLLRRPEVPGTIQIRLLVVDPQTPMIHRSWDPRELGPFSLGFPTSEPLAGWDTALREAGWESLRPMEEYPVPRVDGETYRIQETIFKAPDFVHAVTISRRDGMPQLGPVDPESGRGGPVYSARMTERSDEVLSFFTDVLGMELRSDRQFKSAGTKGALGVPDGTVFRFAIVYSMGASSGHLLFVDYEGDLALPANGVAPRPPHRGLAAWTFPVTDLDEVLRRAEARGGFDARGPIELSLPELGPARVASFIDPDGCLVEVFEPATEPR